MRSTNAQVAQAWREGRAASSAHMSTDGSIIRSYALIIGITTDAGSKVCIDHSAAGGCFHSMTTSTKHLPPTKHCAHVTVRPDEYRDFMEGVTLHVPQWYHDSMYYGTTLGDNHNHGGN